MVSGSPWQAGSLSRKEWFAWMVLLPAAMLLLALPVWLGDANRSLFFLINGANWPWVEPVWSAITVLGDTLTLLLVLLFFVGRRTDLIWAVIVALVVVSLILHGGKAFFDVLRPPGVLSAEEIRTIGFVATNGSFPSGHTTAAFAFAAAIALLRFPLWFKLTVLLFACLAGFSRIVVGIHWPLDVLVGAALGWLGMALSIWLASLMPWGRGLWSQRVIGGLLLIAVIYSLWGFDGGYPAARWVFVVLPLLALAFSWRQLLQLYGVRR